MPAYNNPSGRDLLDNILARLDRAEKDVRKLKASPKRSAFDRGDTAAIPAPLEGQTLIQYDTESPQYYSNGSWRDFAGGTADAFNNPIVFPLHTLNPSALFDTTGFYQSKVDTAVRTNAVFGNGQASGSGTRTPANGDYFTLPVTLGPKGSMWGLLIWFKSQSDGGKFQVSFASVPPSTDVAWGGFTAGALAGAASLTYHTIDANTWDTYQGGSPAEDHTGAFAESFRIDGVDGTAFTSLHGFWNPPGGTTITGINGGAGTYRVKVAVTGKNASSSGYRVELTQMAMFRLNDDGYL